MNNPNQLKNYTQYVSIFISLLTVFYYTVVEKQNVKNQLDYQELQIQRLELELQKKVSTEVYKYLLEDIREIKADIKEIQNDLKS